MIFAGEARAVRFRWITFHGQLYDVTSLEQVRSSLAFDIASPQNVTEHTERCSKRRAVDTAALVHCCAD